eukprot:15436173-Alexandrium_andersonii.AAC.1
MDTSWTSCPHLVRIACPMRVHARVRTHPHHKDGPAACLRAFFLYVPVLDSCLRDRAIQDTFEFLKT